MIQIKTKCGTYAYALDKHREAALTARAEKNSALECLCADRCVVSCICRTGDQAPCVQLALVYAEKIQLCDQLESIADSLPFHVDRMTCIKVANRLLPLLRESHQYEEELLFPIFERNAEAHPARKATVLRLKTEHVYDEDAAEAITEQLMWVGHGGEIENPEALGFMLRAFFDTVRRHVAFEREYVFPLAVSAQIPTPQDNA